MLARILAFTLAIHTTTVTGTGLTICADTPELVRKGTNAIQAPKQLSEVRCGETCCSGISIAAPSRPQSQNVRTWMELAASPRPTTIFVNKAQTVFCARITTSNGEEIPAPYLSLPPMGNEEFGNIIRTLTQKYGREHASEYAAFEPTVGPSVPGQTLIPCGIANNACSCTADLQIYIWADDPHMAETLAHEATHAWLYQTKRPFSHCAGAATTAECRTVDELTTKAEREARTAP